MRSHHLILCLLAAPAAAFQAPAPRGPRAWAASVSLRLRAVSSDNEEEKKGQNPKKKKVVVIGNGMVGQRLMENIVDLDGNESCTLATFCEEPRAAYNRVKLTSYFETRDPSSITMTGPFDKEGRTQWYEDNGVELYLNDKAVSIDTDAKTITGASGRTVDYDVAVMATGSFPFVPPIPGRHRPGVFVYRTIEDLESMLAYAKENNVKSAAVIGGGLLGLEAAKAVADMDVTSHSEY
jgi:nitrite reductase (NADH) large subunit